jgi:IS30 family transposase
VLDRHKLATMRKKGMSLREIAATGKSAMTIQRLLKTEEKKTT